METLVDRITTTPKICNGLPTIRGTRMTIQTVLEYLVAGETEENILAAYPQLEREDIKACLQFASVEPSPEYQLSFAS